MNVTPFCLRLALGAARPVRPAMRGDCTARCCAGAARTARRLRCPVQTACPRPGSPVTQGWPGLWPSHAPGAPGIGRAASWSPSPGRRGWTDGNGEGKIKGPARGWPQTLVCTGGVAARRPVARVLSGGAWAHGYGLRRVPSALGYASLAGSVANGPV